MDHAERNAMGLLHLASREGPRQRFRRLGRDGMHGVGRGPVARAVPRPRMAAGICECAGIGRAFTAPVHTAASVEVGAARTCGAFFAGIAPCIASGRALEAACTGCRLRRPNGPASAGGNASQLPLPRAHSGMMLFRCRRRPMPARATDMACTCRVARIQLCGALTHRVILSRALRRQRLQKSWAHLRWGRPSLRVKWVRASLHASCRPGVHYPAFWGATRS